MNRWQPRGVFIDTNTPAMREVGLVTTPERAGSTINVGGVGLVITLRLIIAIASGIMETTVISLADSGGGAIGSVDNVEGRTTLVLQDHQQTPVGKKAVAIQDIQLRGIYSSRGTYLLLNLSRKARRLL